MSTSNNLLSFTAYARRRGVTQPYISQLVAAGKISRGVVTLDNGTRMIDPDVADSEIQGNADPSKHPVAQRHARQRAGGAAPTTQPEPRFQQAKTATAILDYKIKDIEYRERIKELIEREPAEKAMRAVASAARRAFQKVPDVIATRVAAETDPRRCRMIAAAEIEQTLNDFADSIELLIQQIASTKQ